MALRGLPRLLESILSVRVGYENPSRGSPFAITRLAKTIRIYHELEGRLENPSLGSQFAITRFAETIRIYTECEGRIEKSILRIAVWLHEACQENKNPSRL